MDQYRPARFLLSDLYYATCTILPTLLFLLVSHDASAVPLPKAVTAEALQSSEIEDVDGDGVIEILAFGDSITRGTGDFQGEGDDVSIPSQPTGEAGYPLRLEGYLGVPVSNRGRPGERISEGGVERFVGTVLETRPDIAILSEGANDAFAFLSAERYAKNLQTEINVSYALGVKNVLMKIPPVCCGHAGQRPFIDGYNSQIDRLAQSNALPVVDVPRAFRTLCGDSEECSLLNLPEGLHPNEKGYNVIGQAVAATLLNIDLFQPEGAALFENALSLPGGTVIVKPDVSTAPPVAPVE